MAAQRRQGFCTGGDLLLLCLSAWVDTGMPEVMPRRLPGCLWGCRDGQEDTKMSGRMPRSMAGLAGWMQGCPGRRGDAGQPVSVEELKRSPASKPCVGSALGTQAVKAELAARSTCPVPAACVCCTLPWLAGIAGDHRRWSGTHQRPTQQEWPAKLPVIPRHGQH